MGSLRLQTPEHLALTWLTANLQLQLQETIWGGGHKVDLGLPGPALRSAVGKALLLLGLRLLTCTG